MRSTPVIEACHELIRKSVPFIQEDRIFAIDINNIHQLITSGEILAYANNVAEENGIKLNDNDEFGIY